MPFILVTISIYIIINDNFIFRKHFFTNFMFFSFSCIKITSVAIAERGNEFWEFPRFSLPFSLLAGGKGNVFCWISLFSLPFPASQAERGNGFRGFLCFSLPFSLLAGSKGIEFCWVSLFSLPFGNHTYFKGNGFLEFPRFSLPPPSGTLSSALLFRKSSAEYFLGNYSGSMYGNQ